MSSVAKQRHLHLYVHGKVQGVFFRKYTNERASKLGLVGWVRNLPDGRVEVEAEGPDDQLQRLAMWCRDAGSPKSNVTAVDVDLTDNVTGRFSKFEITK
jgi:acylphosphatase